MALFDPQTVTLKNGKTLTLRPAQVDEAEAVRAAFIEMLATSPFVLSTTESATKRTVEDRRKMIQESNDDPRAYFILAEDQGKIVGMTNMLAFKDSKRLHRAGLGMTVHPDYRGLGLGEFLLRLLIELTAKTEGLRYLELNVMNANVAAHKLYQKLNFTQVGYLPKAYCQPDGTFTDDITMTLDLATVAVLRNGLDRGLSLEG